MALAFQWLTMQTLPELSDSRSVDCLTTAVHELGHTAMPKAVVFRGDRLYDAPDVARLLGLGPGQRCAPP